MSISEKYSTDLMRFSHLFLSPQIRYQQIVLRRPVFWKYKNGLGHDSCPNFFLTSSSNFNEVLSFFVSEQNFGSLVILTSSACSSLCEI